MLKNIGTNYGNYEERDSKNIIRMFPNYVLFSTPLKIQQGRIMRISTEMKIAYSVIVYLK